MNTRKSLLKAAMVVVLVIGMIGVAFAADVRNELTKESTL